MRIRGLISLLVLVLAACEGDGGKVDAADSGPAEAGIGDSGRDVGVDAADEDATADAAGGDARPPEPDAVPFPDAAPLDEPVTINSIVPNRGVVAGGTRVRIVGTGFGAGIQFRFDNRQCADVIVESPNRATCVTPAHLPGPIDILALLEIERLDGVERRQDVLRDGFTYFEGVSLGAVEPARSPLRGGIEIGLTGTGLIEGTRIEIGGRRAQDVHLRNDGVLAARVPPGEPGAHDVTVTNPNGSATLPNAFFYFEDVNVAALDPPMGPVEGGNRVALLGGGLTAQSRVSFGDRETELLQSADDRTRLEVNAPRGRATGAVDVTAANENGEFVLPRGYVYYDPAAPGFGVAGLAPASGPVAGGNDVFVAGHGFGADATVTFDGRELNCDVLDANRLRCTAPPGEIGAVDVAVRSGGEEASLPDGYTYFQQLTLIAVVPDRGAVAGGTRVRMTGTGFAEGIAIELGGQALLDVVIEDETTIIGTTPPNTPGPVDVKVSTPFTRAVLGGGYTYFDPVNRFGGVWGDPIDGAVNVTVLNAASGEPLPEAAVLVINEEGTISLEGLTNATGQVTLSDFDLIPPLIVTAALEGFEVTTIEDVEVENITIYLQPNDGMGDPPPGVPAAILRGEVSGLDQLPKPNRESVVNVIVVETTHSTAFNRTQLPPPGPGGMLTEDGPFEIVARPGELAIIATAGEVDRETLKAYQDGEIGYWEMRQSLLPIAMGIRRFISASPGQEIDDLDVVIDHPMNLTLPVTLDNPPLGPDPGPSYYAVLPRLNFGSEGYWELDTQGVALDPALTLERMPRLDGWDQDLRYYLIGLAFSATADNTPMSITIEETRDIAAGVFITPFVGTPQFEDPVDGGRLNDARHVRWSVHPGFDGPIHPPSANMVLIEEPALGPPKPLWRYVTPSAVTEFDFPALPQAAGEAGLGRGAMFLTVLPFVIDGNFAYDDFTYDELANFRWKGWAVGTITFRQ